MCASEVACDGVLYVTAVDEGVLDTVFSVCHVNVPDAVRLVALQYVASVSSQSACFCDALTDSTRRSSVIKLLSLVSSTDVSVCICVLH